MTTTQTPEPKIVSDATPAVKVNTMPQETPELIRRHVTDENICVLTFDRPDSAANIFDKAALMELSDHINYVMCNSNIKGLVLTSAKKSIFVLELEIVAVDIDRWQAVGAVISDSGRDQFICHLAPLLIPKVES